MTAPCPHLTLFITSYVKSPVTLMNDTGDDHPVIACEVGLTFEEFDELALKEARRTYGAVIADAARRN